jgi:hypothetical protein
MSNAIGKTNLLIINEHIKLRIAKKPWIGSHNAQNNTGKEGSGHTGGVYVALWATDMDELIFLRRLFGSWQPDKCGMRWHGYRMALHLCF